MTTSPNPLNQSDAKALRDEWVKRIEDLLATVEGWATDLGWSTRQIPIQMHDSEIGSYPARALLLQRETMRVLLEPIARLAPGAEGVADLYLLPAYDDIASLYLVDGTWQLHYMYPNQRPVATIRQADPTPLTKNSLSDVLDAMRTHAV